MVRTTIDEDKDSPVGVGFCKTGQMRSKSLGNVKKRTGNNSVWPPAYTPGDGQTSWVYSNNPVLHLYICI